MNVATKHPQVPMRIMQLIMIVISQLINTMTSMMMEH